MTREQAIGIAHRYFNEQDADWNVLGALALNGEITPQTYAALSEFHQLDHASNGTMTCAGVLAGHLCDLLELREWVREIAELEAWLTA